MYIPDNWIILEIKKGDDKPYHKVLAGWSGGYLTGDNWRMNSGIVKIEEDENNYYVHGETGSVYKLLKGAETIRMNIAGVYNSLKEDSKSHNYSVNIVKMNDIKNI